MNAINYLVIVIDLSYEYVVPGMNYFLFFLGYDILCILFLRVTTGDDMLCVLFLELLLLYYGRPWERRTRFIG